MLETVVHFIATKNIPIHHWFSTKYLKSICVAVFLLIMALLAWKLYSHKVIVLPPPLEPIVVENSSSSVSEATNAVEVSGAVKTPGVYTVPVNSRVNDVLKLAGGFKTTADIVWVSKNISLAEVTKDATKIYIPFQWDNFSTNNNQDFITSNVKKFEDTKSNVKDTNNNPSSNKEPNKTPSTTSINNINSCAKDVLLALDGVGDVYASKIIANRPFTDIDDLIAKIKLPDKVVNEIKTNLTFN